MSLCLGVHLNWKALIVVRSLFEGVLDLKPAIKSLFSHAATKDPLCLQMCGGNIAAHSWGSDAIYMLWQEENGHRHSLVGPAVQASRKTWVIEGRCCWPRLSWGGGLSKKRCLSTSLFTGGDGRLSWKELCWGAFSWRWPFQVPTARPATRHFAFWKLNYFKM